MSYGEGIVMGCPPVFQVDTDEGRLVSARISYWRDEDTLAAGATGFAQLSFSPQVARDLAKALLREAEKSRKVIPDPIHGLKSGKVTHAALGLGF
jgi:hypothetical protein